ncbi:EF-hand domain-containing family member C2 [Larimichthys crocea]|uniref:EF-hand domain-containing family member C2 n=2 Tax=Larimichthys crocea TaxID=215358 RepID=A0A0F8AI67_LARCR|nr:EF-hand domain-containing family member C2 isoform X1 [Larimichthys crocea]KAE8299783.1 EF-hand domain-containing family member C2 [Larimichthys crocea]TMS06312.1 EF-hand domain-containing family member C2 [Larimichthys crocea]
MALPFLPGNSPNKQLGKERFHKSQHFDYSNGVHMLVGSAKPGIGGELLADQKIKPKYSVYPQGQGSHLPSWVAFDKQALCFEAYFQEAVLQSRDETYRIRKCKIFFYLEDDTIQVVEPEYKNSRIPQGTLIYRQRIPLPPPDDDQFYNIFHFNISQQMVLYSRTFTLTNCDSFTRNFLTKLGVHLNDSTTVPDDPYSNLREETEKSMKPLRPYERHDTLKQFLDHDRKVLRFFCLWNDTGSVFGDSRDLILHYFLADDTIEIREVISPNSGRDTVAKFLHRSKLPKCPARMKQPGEITDRTVLNVFASPSQGKRFILDSLKTGAVHEDFYKDCDLTVGGEVNVWGRRVIITDCDDFTKDYYRSKYGIEDFTPVQYKASTAPQTLRPVPPYNGFGSEEDSLSSCKGLLPKPPKADFQKFMEKDRCGLDSNVLNFRAKMVTTDAVDRDRVFIISFYLCDDSISVFERPQRNSGVLGGKFLQRGRIKKPGQELFKSELSEYFTAQDLYVGVTLCLNNKHFQLLDADEYTFNYMEQHAEEFPKANVGNILSKLRSTPEEKQSEIRKFLALSDPSNTGFIPYESLRGLLMGLDCGLSVHEVLVLCRRFSEREQPQVDLGLMLAVAQDFLKKKNFEELPDMARAFTHQDRHKTGRLSTKETRTVCKAFQLPLPDNLLGGLLSKFADGDDIDYHAFLAGINWIEHPAPSVVPEDTFKFEMDARFDAGGATVKNINYSSLLGDVFSLQSINGDPTTATSA